MFNQNNPRKVWSLFSWLIIVILLVNGCSSNTKKTYLIGVASESHNQDTVFEGVKSKLTELGYVEGQNVTYIYHDVLGTDPQANDAEIKSFMDQKVDLILSLGTAPTVAAQKGTDGTDIPVVFAPVMDPVGEGIVPSLKHPGGHLTGVQTIDNTPKVLEMLVRAAPDLKQVYAPYNSNDKVALMIIKSLPDVAATLGVKLILDDVSNGDEELAAIKNLPDYSGILFVTSPSLNKYLEDAVNLAIDLDIPTASRTRTVENMMIIYTAEPTSQGQQAGILIDKIFKGAAPGDLPVATGELFLVINLKTAQAIAVNIPDGILKQAQKIIR